MESSQLSSILQQLISLPQEIEWVEFKQDNAKPETIGEYISALSNSATLHGQNAGYIVWGIENNTHSIVGTNFNPKQSKVSNEELENWLLKLLSPRVSFRIYEFTYQSQEIALFEIPCASHQPVRFQGTEYIRVGSYKKKLKDYPEKERELWSSFSRQVFEKRLALENLTANEVLAKINYPAYFELTEQHLPDDKQGILERRAKEKLINVKPSHYFDITNLGAILFAKNFTDFDRLGRKSIRVIIYKDKNRIVTQREQVFEKGYAISYEEIIHFINAQIPQNEQIGQALRKNIKMYPDIAIRELVANAIIHQDFSLTGVGSTIEIFSDRIEIRNPGEPLVDTMRFIDVPPQSRNEDLAAFMRRIKVCEERGSGIDKVVHSVEVFQLPAPEFNVKDKHTEAILFSYKELKDMDKSDRIRACYQHACLRYVCREQMTNESLRKRFVIDDKNYSTASRIIADTINEGFIKPYDPENKSKKHAKYIPYWA
ncbi:MAG: putative DNA binding domain-containing protein [Roseofilum sp. SBFL]|uniref:RNA-binding domain-containing protein n=1 Tax=unclassified Roseofilum TaxID=2620099 RepID=UPI001B187A95|nr:MULTISPECIES: RNA-binding domain-containing protein [unclassified Roseofilum]MBP0013121.1 putative DNA binding domain-containing protein [Roseofilum sp. SID3]MBP0023711.1 putative DNA binding domain-containing protein [Roseofilum sp. SID2]MBP0036784.1 putative DNA binding domain-containing protein [Roseofilum sp. SID1]MBP0042573.1 putative DNA binding domain-containing protein [Roseofilum sp. SBFL]